MRGNASIAPTPLLNDPTRQQESLRHVIESISSELELRPLLTRIIWHACELLDVENGTIGLVIPERQTVRTEAAHNMPPGEIGAEMPVGSGIFGQILLTREPTIFPMYAEVTDAKYPQLHTYTVLGVPIVWRGELIGVFGLGSPPPRQFGTHDIEVLSLFAKHAAIAIENARRYEREHQQTERLVRIARIGHLLTADHDIDHLLETVATAIPELLGYPNVAIPLLDADDPEILVLRVFGGYYRELMHKQEYRLPITSGIMGAAVRERKVQLVNDVHADPRHIPTPNVTGIIAELALPIMLGNRVYGVLNIESDERFTEEDSVGLQIVADQLAVAVENARLFTDVQRTLEEKQQLYETSLSQFQLLSERGQQVAVLEERQRLARELHDSVTQMLFSMTLIAQSLGSAWSRDREEGERRVERLLELSQNALAEMRVLLSNLRPQETPPLASPPASGGILSVRQHGLVAALRLHAAGVALEGIEITAETQGYTPQYLEAEETLFRIAQEALNNVVKHAKAQRVQIRLHTNSNSAFLSIKDNGSGFIQPSPDSPQNSEGERQHIGLSIMRERAEEMGGQLRIVSSPGNGTVIEAILPLRKERE